MPLHHMLFGRNSLAVSALPDQTRRMAPERVIAAVPQLLLEAHLQSTWEFDRKRDSSYLGLRSETVIPVDLSQVAMVYQERQTRDDMRRSHGCLGQMEASDFAVVQTNMGVEGFPYLNLQGPQERTRCSYLHDLEVRVVWQQS